MKARRSIVLVALALAISIAAPRPALAMPKTLAKIAYWGGLALRPVPGAIKAGLTKRWRGATHLDELMHADLSKRAPAELADKARSLLYANLKQRVFRRADLRLALRRVLDAYDADADGRAKTDVLLSRMILTEQNAARMARRLGHDSVRAIRDKLVANRIDSTLPVADRVAELKQRLALDNGAGKAGKMTFYKTGRSIQNAMLAQVRQATAAARRGEPAYYVFSTYAFEDDGPGHAVGAAFSRALHEAADAGVEIVGLYDRLGSIHSGVEGAETRRAFYDELVAHAAPDGQRRIALVPIAASPFMAHGSHQKWSIATGAEGASAMIQDANLGSLYQGPNATWQDTATRLEGPIVEDFGRMALARLRANGYKPSDALAAALLQKRKVPEGAHAVDLHLLDHVAGQDLKNKRLVLNAIAATGRGDVIEWSQPYGQDDDVTEALVRAARDRGVEIHLVYDRRNNQPTVATAARDSYARLIGAGVKVHEYGRVEGQDDVSPSTKVFSHAKVLIVKFANGMKMMATGSANGDNRSFGDEPALGILTGNDEAVAVTFDAQKIARLDRAFMKPQLTEHSVLVTAGEAKVGLGGRVVGWLLDKLRGFN